VVVDEVDKGYVTAYGPGLSLGLSGKECTFHVVGPSSEYNHADVAVLDWYQSPAPRDLYVSVKKSNRFIPLYASSKLIWVGSRCGRHSVENNYWN